MIKYLKSFNKTLKDKQIILVTYGILFILIGYVISFIGDTLKTPLIEFTGLVLAILGVILIVMYMYNDMKEDLIKFFKDVKNNIED